MYNAPPIHSPWLPISSPNGKFLLPSFPGASNLGPFNWERFNRKWPRPTEKVNSFVDFSRQNKSDWPHHIELYYRRSKLTWLTTSNPVWKTRNSWSDSCLLYEGAIHSPLPPSLWIRGTIWNKNKGFVQVPTSRQMEPNVGWVVLTLVDPTGLEDQSGWVWHFQTWGYTWNKRILTTIRKAQVGPCHSARVSAYRQGLKVSGMVNEDDSWRVVMVSAKDSEIVDSWRAHPLLLYACLLAACPGHGWASD